MSAPSVPAPAWRRRFGIVCAHCGQLRRGSAGVMIGGRAYNLCHPDTGMDCYRLVTVYGHRPYDCVLCAPKEIPMSTAPAQVLFTETERVDSLAVLRVQDAWLELPLVAQQGLVWWELVAQCAHYRMEGAIQPVTPLYEVEIHILSDAEQVRAFPVKDDGHRVQAIKDTAAYDLENGNAGAVAFCQYAFDRPVL